MADMLYQIGQLDAVRLGECLQYTVEHIPNRAGLGATPDQLRHFVETIRGFVV
jgi:hypothetical protein